MSRSCLTRLPQPARAILFDLGITNRAVADQLGYSPAWVGRILRGEAPAPEGFRAGVAAMLGRPESELFRDDEREQQLADAFRLLVRTTEEQGIPLGITDPVVIERVLGILQSGIDHPAHAS